MDDRCYSAISSHSLGRAWVHDLPSKLTQAAEAGFAGVEIFHEDLLFHTRQLYNTEDVTNEQKVSAAQAIRRMCADLHLSIVCLQPFRNFEGLRDPHARAAKLAEAEHWIAMAHALGTDLIAIASTLMPASETTGFPARLAADLAAVADAGATADPPIRFTYEALCFGTHVRSWQQSYEIVKMAGRRNLGICIDTFNLAGWVFADPAVAGGVRSDGSARLAASLDELVRTVDPTDIFYIQVVDAERMVEPLVKGHPLYVADQPARMSWSRACRLFYGEMNRGAYMPIRDVLDALFTRINWRGWVSAELFSRTLEDPDASTPEHHAKRGIESWERVLNDFPQLQTAQSPHGTDGAQDHHVAKLEHVSKSPVVLAGKPWAAGEPWQVALQFQSSKL